MELSSLQKLWVKSQSHHKYALWAPGEDADTFFDSVIDPPKAGVFYDEKYFEDSKVKRSLPMQALTSLTQPNLHKRYQIHFSQTNPN